MLLRLIFIMGVLPALVLMYYIYRLDRIEREPMGLLLKVFIFGAISTQVASILESIGDGVLSALFADPYDVLRTALMYFVVVAVSEELVKYLAMRLATKNRSEFNYRFDGVVYGVAASLGFAALENIMYILGFGFGVAPIRAVTAIPLHCITGVFMGHYYGMAMYLERRDVAAEASVYRVLTLLIPVLIHGFYDFCATMQSTVWSLIFIAYVIILDVIAIISVKHYAAQDAHL